MRFRAFLLPLLLTGSCTMSGQTGTPGSLLHAPDLRLEELSRRPDGSGELFVSYNPEGPSRWNPGWPWKLDLSGVAWDQTTTVTAITPRHVIMAAHYPRRVGSDAVFHDRNGRPHVRKIERIISLPKQGLHPDVAVGLLDRPLPDSVRRYPLPELPAAAGANLVGATALVTDQKRRLFFHRIRAIDRGRVGFRIDPDLPDGRTHPLVKGDSGNPSFLLSKGELVLLETHTHGGSGSGPFYGDPETLNAIRNAVAQLDPAYPVRTVAIDQVTLGEAARNRESTPGVAPPTTARPSPESTPASPAPGGQRSPRKRITRPAE